MTVNLSQSQSPVLGWAQRPTAPDGSRPPRTPALRAASAARSVDLRVAIDVASGATPRAFATTSLLDVCAVAGSAGARTACGAAAARRGLAMGARAWLPLLLATYLGAAACATPRYVSDNHAALQSPVTLGDGHTGKPALDELPKEPAPAPAVHLAPCAPAVHPAPGSPQPNAAEANTATSASGASQPTATTSVVGATTSGLDASQPTSTTSASGPSQPTAAEPAAAPSGTTTSTAPTAVHPTPGTQSVTTSTPGGTAAAPASSAAQPSTSAPSPAAGAAATAPGAAPSGASATRARLQPFGLHSRVTKPRTAAAPAPGASQSSVATTASGASAATATPCVASTAAPAVSGASAAPAGTPAVAGAPASQPSVAALLSGGSTPETEPGSEGAAASAAAPFDPRATPDPEPQSTTAYYELTLRYCNAGVHLVANRRVKLSKPSALPRKMGRFAAELWIGHELLERARFDFPMTGADSVLPAGTAQPEPPPLQLAPGADVVWKVKVADRVRATQAWVIDRATGERWLLDWPPAATKAKPTADAACPSFGGK